MKKIILLYQLFSMKKLPIILLLSIFAFTLFAEENPVSKKKPHRKYALNVYMYASNYLKKEVPFINFVRDVQDADLVVLETFQSTGSGGGEYTFFVDGQKKFAGIKDTVKFHTYPDDTDEQVMRKGATVFKMGLMMYILETPMAEFIDIQFTEPIEEEVSTDKWNNWVFTTSLSGSLQGKQSVDARAFGTSINANRTTQKWRLSTGIIFNTSKTEYDYGDFNVTDKSEDSRIYSDIVKSLGEHWALGASSDEAPKAQCSPKLFTISQ